MQVIIHEDNIGIWLELGRNNGSINDRKYFRRRMRNTATQLKFFEAFKMLSNEYSISVSSVPKINIKTPEDLLRETLKERIDKYFIIGCEIDWFDDRLSEKNISNTVLKEFKNLYQLYKIMRHI